MYNILWQYFSSYFFVVSENRFFFYKYMAVSMSRLLYV